MRDLPGTTSAPTQAIYDVASACPEPFRTTTGRAEYAQSWCGFGRGFSRAPGAVDELPVPSEQNLVPSALPGSRQILRRVRTSR